MKHLFAILFLSAAAACSSPAPPLYPPPLSPEAALESFRLVDGFRVELFAAEPYTADPVEMVFDEQGKIYVVEMPDYPFKPEAGQARSRVRVLEDKDGDGRIDASAIFAEGLMEATSVLPWSGGLLVCAAPDILYFKDHDGDGIADEKEVLFTGFFDQNSEAQITNLRYGLDNWIYASNFGQRGRISCPRFPDMDTVDIQGADFRFQMSPFRFEAATGITQFGQDQDDWGHRLVTMNTVHARHIVIDRKYLRQNPMFQKKQALHPTYQDGTRMYQLTPPPYWRAERTARRQKAYDEEGKGRIEHAADHFTGCSGTTFYLADGFPDAYYGSVFTGDVAGNLVHRDLFYPMPESPSFHTKRPEGEQDREFLASTDPWFRPANFTVGPDGYLYVIDMYRQHIETPLSIPEDLKQDMDFYAGMDKGRIYRILPADSASVRPTQLTTLYGDEQELLGLLTHKNRWYRLTAQRLIVERQAVNLTARLREMAAGHASPQARIHALYTLEGLGALDQELVIKALSDPVPGIRENAVKLAEGFPEAFLRLRPLLDDPSPRVALQALLSIGASTTFPDKPALMAHAAGRWVEDEWFRLGILCSLSDAAAARALIEALDQQPGFWQDSTAARLELLGSVQSLIDKEDI